MTLDRFERPEPDTSSLSKHRDRQLASTHRGARAGEAITVRREVRAPASAGHGSTRDRGESLEEAADLDGDSWIPTSPVRADGEPEPPSPICSRPTQRRRTARILLASSAIIASPRHGRGAVRDPGVRRRLIPRLTTTATQRDARAGSRGPHRGRGVVAARDVDETGDRMSSFRQPGRRATVHEGRNGDGHARSARGRGHADRGHRRHRGCRNRAPGSALPPSCRRLPRPATRAGAGRSPTRASVQLSLFQT